MTLTKQEKSAKEEKSQQRRERIRRHEEAMLKESAETERRRKTMEEKAQLYERMTGGEQIVYDDGSKAEFLVNFNIKKRELETRSDSEDDDESRKRTPPPPLIQHYNPSEEKGRILGPSHAPLPLNNEEERSKKIQEIKDMSKKTDDVRKRRKKQLDEKKRAEREKSKKFRAKHNLSPLSSTSEEESETEEVVASQPSSSTKVLEPDEKRMRYGVREWDEEKWGHNRWLKKQRDERDDEFRPCY